MLILLSTFFAGKYAIESLLFKTTFIFFGSKVNIFKFKKTLRFLNKYLIHFNGEEEMESRVKIVYTIPKQIPLFEEDETGLLKQYDKDEK